jgi:hypothetical protein
LVILKKQLSWLQAFVLKELDDYGAAENVLERLCACCAAVAAERGGSCSDGEAVELKHVSIRPPILVL